jgi:hypothetical protein
MKVNCWEFKKCGRESQGPNAAELGVCPACFPSGKFGQQVAIPKLWFMYNSTIGGRSDESKKEARA